MCGETENNVKSKVKSFSDNDNILFPFYEEIHNVKSTKRILGDLYAVVLSWSLVCNYSLANWICNV